ncbi:MAG: hypothetical protein AAGF12_24185, partial [Myxococcota bacterium]
DAVARTLHGVSDLLSEQTYKDACDRGVQGAGDLVDDNIDGLIDIAATFTLAGTATGTEISTDNIAQRLEPGNWTGSWDERGTGMTISGTFVGQRR